MAENNRYLFEEQGDNPIQPTNLAKVNRIFPQIMEHGYAGKVLVEFDINAEGKALNPRIVTSTREEIFDKAAYKLLSRFQFEKGKPMNAVRYDIGFCLLSDSITPVFCDIHYERIAGPKEPRVTVYSVPYFTPYHIKKGICGSVTVRFDVDASGAAQNVKIVNSTRPGQFEIGLKRALARFQFEKDKPTEGIEYKVTYHLPGRC